MSTIVPTDVKLKGRVVEVADVEVFSTVDEALAKLGNEAVLSLLNRQHKADTCNAIRAKHRPSTASKKKIRQLAFELCANDPELNDELMSKMGNYDALMEFLDSPELVARVHEEILSGATGTEDEDDDNND